MDTISWTYLEALQAATISERALATMHTIEGRFDVAQGVLDESDSVDDAIGEARIGSGRLALAATGEKVRRHRPESRDDFTAQEAQIAQLARAGDSNPEIAAQLFLSPRTVEWQLRKVFGKLGISSRRELDAALPDGETAQAIASR